MKSKKRRLWIILLIVFIVIQWRGYYVRNLKVDDEFLEVIVEKVVMLEDKRKNSIIHTPEDEFQIDKELNTGYMAKKSNLEMDIAVRVQVMSSNLREYFEGQLNNNNENSSEALSKYFENLSLLEKILEEFRNKRTEVNVLWEKGIF